MSAGSWIGPEQHALLGAVLLAAAALGLWAERTSWGSRLSGAMVAILLTALLANLGVIPTRAPLYDAVWTYLVPLAIPLLLLRADLRRVVRETGPLLLGFLAGAAGTVLGVLVAVAVVPLGERLEAHLPQLAGVFAATYIGGSMNYAAVAQALGLDDPEVLAAGVAADGLMMVLLFLVLFLLPELPRLRARYRERPGLEAGEGGAGEGGAAELPPAAAPYGTLEAATALALAAGLAVLGYGAEAAAGLPGLGVLLLTALAVAFATLWPGAARRLAPAEGLGMLFMQLFFAAIGAGAHVGAVLRAGAQLFLFAGVVLAVHLAVLLLAGRLLGLDLREVVLASNANAGGPTTAAAMAAARGWRPLITPAILCGVLGYAGASFVGVALGRLLA